MSILAAYSTSDTSLSVRGLHWRERITSPVQEREALAIAQQQRLPELLARVLVGRGVSADTAEHYLTPSLREHLPDPAHLRDMDNAIACLTKAITAGETIGIFGDYDVDGATSSAVLAHYIHSLGLRTVIHIPDRQKEGYGPSIEAFRSLKARGAAVIVTVDCGTMAHDVLAQAADEAMQVVVIDHHQSLAELPRAVAVVNPNRLDETSEYRYLAAVGVVFLVLVGLNRALRERGFFTPTQPEPNLLQLLDIVALGTVADVVPLIGLNRAFVTQGLKVLATRRQTGLRALMDSAKVQEAPGAYHLGFLLGPRINAGGRVGKASLGVELLLSDDAQQAFTIAQELEQYNKERRSIEAVVLEAAMEQAERQHNRSIILVAAEGWHQGVIGIVAGRIKEQFERPAIVCAIDNGIAKASARSVSGVDIGAAISAAVAAEHVLYGGGHIMAGGFSAKAESLEILHDFLESRLGDDVREYLAHRALTLDGWVHADAITMQLAEALEQAAPYGMSNPAPRIGIHNARIINPEIIGEHHVRFGIVPHHTSTAQQASKRYVRGIAFRCTGQPLGDALFALTGQPVQLAASIKRNFWQGRPQLNVEVQDIMVASS